MRKIVEARVLGPYAEKDRWRIIILEKGARRSEYLATLPEARKRISQLKKQQGKAEAFTVGMMLDAYSKDREVTGKVLQLTAQEQAARIRDFLAGVLDMRVSSITAEAAAKLYHDLMETPCRRSGENPGGRKSSHILELREGSLQLGSQKGIL